MTRAVFPEFKATFATSAQASGKSKRQAPVDGLLAKAKGAAVFMSEYGGMSFEQGLYRVHSSSDVKRWTNIINGAFPEYRQRIQVFGFDWMGRTLALDAQRSTRGDPLVLMFDPGTGDAFEVPATFRSYHEEEIIQFKNDALASDMFEKWRKKSKVELKFDQCVGFKVPLFLGGKDTLKNYEVTDLEVYWELSAQLLAQARDLEEGTSIGGLSISD